MDQPSERAPSSWVKRWDSRVKHKTEYHTEEREVLSRQEWTRDEAFCLWGQLGYSQLYKSLIFTQFFLKLQRAAEHLRVGEACLRGSVYRAPEGAEVGQDLRIHTWSKSPVVVWCG